MQWCPWRNVKPLKYVYDVYEYIHDKKAEKRSMRVSRPRQSHKPGVEVLEVRCLPST